jgi:maltose O-acetyltransferase
MKTEKQKMIAGELYDASDSQLVTERQRARNLLRRLNESREDDQEERGRILMELIGAETNAHIQPPFFCDYGTNIRLGKKVFMNFNCLILDVAPVHIGFCSAWPKRTDIYRYPSHTCIRAAKRIEAGKPIIIGSEAWVGGGAIICPGVEDGRTVGNRGW